MSNLQEQPEDIICPVCGYYCLGKGGTGCIDKPALMPTLQEKNWEEDFIEKGASLEHERWSNWQKYLHSLCSPHKLLSYNSTKRDYEDIETGGLVIGKSRVEHWERQINTPYSELSEKEKEYDRIEVRKYLPMIKELLTQQNEEVIRKIDGIKVNQAKVYETTYYTGYNQALSDLKSLLSPHKGE